MSTSSQHLGLILNDESDPFLRTDFTANWNKIDQYPGVFICTSSTLPAWTANQAGQSVYLTDSRRTLHWDGATWHAGTDLSPSWTGSISPGVSMTHNQTVKYTIGTVVTRTPATLMVTMVAEGRQNNGPSAGSPLGLSVYPLIDNANASTNTGAGAFYSQWDTSLGGGFNDYRSIPVIGVKAVAAGSHPIGIQVTTSLGSNGGAFIQASFVATLVNTTDV